MEHLAAEAICYTQRDGPNSLEMMNKKSPPTQNISPCDPKLLLFMQNNNRNSRSIAVSLIIIVLLCFYEMTFVLPFTCESLLLQFTHCLGFYCCPEKSVSVLLDLLFQFITQPPFTLTPACCQSLWPV